MSVILAFYVAPFGRGGGFRDAGVRLGQSISTLRWQQASHVEALCVPHVKEANLCVSASKRDGYKVRRKVIEWHPRHWVFVECEWVKSGDFAKRVEPHIGKSYDRAGAICSALPDRLCKTAPDPDRWFCSELVAHGLGYPAPWLFTPGALRADLRAFGAREFTIQ
jgi:hypothetical protein